MHRDIDEFHGKGLPPVPAFGEVEVSKDDFHYPEFGHVLYLGVEGDEELDEGAGGTVLLSPPSPLSSHSNLYVVPPLTGRLLRFQGDKLHAVPRPALSYFNSDEVEGGSNHLIFTKKARDKARRQVLLFNTWKSPPSGDWEASRDWEASQEPPLDIPISPRSSWKLHDLPIPSTPPSEALQYEMKIPLLGDRRRREGRVQRSFKLKVYDSPSPAHPS
eukprot:CAMPEP_0118635854 /NCGR_PEP_ID=MMETSP0785-20121206/2298_1 /TAXON_ID=91992 /ORGANISM="Bolidomonas pacifica, Strain CCMP 1866" /LENGTH=216 /DNA_ID=CAMNT_0006526915 /DNA_START=301 /DNA_END=947 /DNA_ORIENTATION=+